jgi:hypothetical protein
MNYNNSSRGERRRSTTPVMLTTGAASSSIDLLVEQSKSRCLVRFVASILDVMSEGPLTLAALSRAMTIEQLPSGIKNQLAALNPSVWVYVKSNLSIENHISCEWFEQATELLTFVELCGFYYDVVFFAETQSTKAKRRRRRRRAAKSSGEGLAGEESLTKMDSDDDVFVYVPSKSEEKKPRKPRKKTRCPENCHVDNEHGRCVVRHNKISKLLQKIEKTSDNKKKSGLLANIDQRKYKRLVHNARSQANSRKTHHCSPCKRNCPVCSEATPPQFTSVPASSSAVGGTVAGSSTSAKFSSPNTYSVFNEYSSDYVENLRNERDAMELYIEQLEARPSCVDAVHKDLLTFHESNMCGDPDHRDILASYREEQMAHSSTRKDLEKACDLMKAYENNSEVRALRQANDQLKTIAEKYNALRLEHATCDSSSDETKNMLAAEKAKVEEVLSRAKIADETNKKIISELESQIHRANSLINTLRSSLDSLESSTSTRENDSSVVAPLSVADINCINFDLPDNQIGWFSNPQSTKLFNTAYGLSTLVESIRRQFAAWGHDVQKEFLDTGCRFIAPDLSTKVEMFKTLSIENVIARNTELENEVNRLAELNKLAEQELLSHRESLEKDHMEANRRERILREGFATQQQMQSEVALDRRDCLREISDAWKDLNKTRFVTGHKFKVLEGTFPREDGFRLTVEWVKATSEITEELIEQIKDSIQNKSFTSSTSNSWRNGLNLGLSFAGYSVSHTGSHTDTQTLGWKVGTDHIYRNKKSTNSEYKSVLSLTGIIRNYKTVDGVERSLLCYEPVDIPYTYKEHLYHAGAHHTQLVRFRSESYYVHQFGNLSEDSELLYAVEHQNELLACIGRPTLGKPDKCPITLIDYVPNNKLICNNSPFITENF